VSEPPKVQPEESPFNGLGTTELIQLIELQKEVGSKLQGFWNARHDTINKKVKYWRLIAIIEFLVLVWFCWR
jgi:hypothetical protein